MSRLVASNGDLQEVNEGISEEGGNIAFTEQSTAQS
jgi:hypothetical protein